MDWGVAKVLAGAGSAAPPSAGVPAGGLGGTAAGTVVGTLAYMAPEQAEGAAERAGPPRTSTPSERSCTSC